MSSARFTPAMVRPDKAAEAPFLREAAKPFRRAGIGPWMFARGKLAIDPIYAAILRSGLLPTSGRIADLGCGQGITLAAILAAQSLDKRGELPRGWQPPPGDVELLGFDVREGQVAIARMALGREARIEIEDLLTLRLPRCRAITLFDSLHYLAEEAQRTVLENVAASLEPGGALLLREVDADGGIGFETVRYSEILRARARGHWGQKFYFRSGKEWVTLVQGLGFEVRVEDMSGNTPFRNVLLHGVRRSE